ncbi:MAG: hypothetical protein M3323_12480 [Actinomycetota bacterium]|nr:hypothetical protein [Actinomycetota bacterium]
MTRALFVVAFAATVMTLEAGAQVAVKGGAGFVDAPDLGTGEHRDTIRPGETLYYGVEVPEGMVLKVRAILDSRDRLQPLETRLQLYNARRVADPFARDGGFIRPPRGLGLFVRSGRVGAPSPDYPVSGTHYFSVSVAAPRNGVPAELSLVLGVNVKPAPPRPTPAPMAPPLEPPPPVGRGPTYAFAAVGGLLLGGVAAFVASKLKEPPPGFRRRL